MVKIAYICMPCLGGTYGMFLALRRPLLDRGYDLRCIGIINKTDVGTYIESNGDGCELWHVSSNTGVAVRQTLAGLEQGLYSVAMSLPLGYPVESSLPLYLPLSIRLVVNVPGLTLTIYEIAEMMAGYADAVVCVSDRIKNTLISRKRISHSLLTTIHNGVDLKRFHQHDRASSCESGLRLVYLGRLADIEKGVLLLPRIMKSVVKDCPSVTLDVYGSGPDQGRLASLISKMRLDGVIRLLGPIDNDKVPLVLSSYDCFMLPSRTEAFSVVLLEAMASGCVPIASDIAGSTDVVIEHGVSGFLVRVGDIAGFALTIKGIVGKREMLTAMAAAGRTRVEQRFSVDAQADRYASLFHAVLRQAPRKASPLAIDRFSLPKQLARRWRSYLPVRIKQFLRMMYTRRGKPC